MLLQLNDSDKSSSTDPANVRNDAAVLSHPFIKMGVLQNCDNSVSFLDHNNRASTANPYDEYCRYERQAGE